jgi:hypothetical protein
MYASPNNMTQEDMERVALGFGCDVWEGTNHTSCQHPQYPQLIVQWPRHGKILPVYVENLIKMIEKLEKLKGE